MHFSFLFFFFKHETLVLDLEMIELVTGGLRERGWPKAQRALNLNDTIKTGAGGLSRRTVMET